MSGGTIDEATMKSWKEVTDLAEHFISYDLYLILAPMWNFTCLTSSTLYYVIMQAGILFSYTAHGPEGFAKYEKMVCITSRGSDYSAGGPMSVHSHKIFRQRQFQHLDQKIRIFPSEDHRRFDFQHIVKRTVGTHQYTQHPHAVGKPGGLR